MKNFKLSAILIIALGLLVIGCNQDPVTPKALGPVEIKCIDSLNSAKTITPTFPSGETNITHYEISVENTTNASVKATKIVEKNDTYTVTNLIEGNYNIKAKALIVANENAQNIDDFVVVAEVGVTKDLSAKEKQVTLNFTPETLLTTGESGDITINVKLPFDYAQLPNVELKYTVTKILGGKITEASTGSEKETATETLSCSVMEKDYAVLTLKNANGTYNFAPGSYKIVVELMDNGEAVRTGVENMRLFKDHLANGEIDLRSTANLEIGLSIADSLGDYVVINDGNATVTGDTMKFSLTTNSNKNLVYEWYMDGKLLSQDSDYTVSGNQYQFKGLNDGQHVFTVFAKEDGTALGIGSRTVFVNVHNSEIGINPGK